MAKNNKKTAYQIVMESRQIVVDKFIELLSDDSICWQQEWFSSRPYNPVTGTIYKGGNFVRLSVASAENNYHDPRWLTFKNITDKGYKLKAGSKGVMCEKWKLVERKKHLRDKAGKLLKDANGNYIIDPNEKEEYMIVNYFTVFNGDCIDGLERLEKQKCTDNNLPKYIFDNSPVPILDDESPFYDFKQDAIHLPRCFYSESAKYYTFYRHLVEATGIRSRLNRNFGSAEEALICELGAVFLAADTKLEVWIENSVAHINEWCNLLRENYNIFFTAAKEAECAVGWIEDVTGLEEAC